MIRTMLESDLAKPVMDWLAGRGFTPFGEVKFCNRAIDVVGLSDTELEAVELKLCLTRHVIYQAYLNQLASNRSWCAVSTRPRRFAERVLHGLGLLVVTPAGVEVLVEAQESHRILNRRRMEQVRGACAYKTPHGPAGTPTMRGIGPAQMVYDAVERYRSGNPGAGWDDVFANVPNHYAHQRSMQGAMRVVRGRRANWKSDDSAN